MKALAITVIAVLSLLTCLALASCVAGDVKPTADQLATRAQALMVADDVDPAVATPQQDLDYLKKAAEQIASEVAGSKWGQIGTMAMNILLAYLGGAGTLSVATGRGRDNWSNALNADSPGNSRLRSVAANFIGVHSPIEAAPKGGELAKLKVTT